MRFKSKVTKEEWAMHVSRIDQSVKDITAIEKRVVTVFQGLPVVVSDGLTSSIAAGILPALIIPINLAKPLKPSYTYGDSLANFDPCILIHSIILKQNKDFIDFVYWHEVGHHVNKDIYNGIKKLPKDGLAEESTVLNDMSAEIRADKHATQQLNLSKKQRNNILGHLIKMTQNASVDLVMTDPDYSDFSQERITNIKKNAVTELARALRARITAP